MKLSINLKIFLTALSITLLVAIFLLNPFQLLPFHSGVNGLLKYTAVLLLFAIPVEYFWGTTQRKLFDVVWWNDYLHIAKNIPTAILIGATVFFIPDGKMPVYSETHGKVVGFVSGLNFWLQLFLVLFVADLYNYWSHRISHKFDVLWYSHAVHHSIKKVDFLGGFRNHVIDQFTFRIGQALLYLTFGFDPKAIGLAMIIVPLNTSLQHLNIPFRIKFLEPWISTPFFHHWHHDIKIGNSKNYSNMFPFIDKIFGTYYLPDHWPNEVGIKDHPVSDNFLMQMIYPFKCWWRDLKSAVQKRTT